jgi:predicted glutamine amidotransferase
VLKRPGWAAKSAAFVRSARTISTRMAVCHIRRASVGRRDLINTHPFLIGNWILAQNGRLGRRWHDRMASSLAPGAILGATSGEHLLAWLHARVGDRSGLDQRQGIIACLQALVARPRGIFSANFILGTGDYLFAFRYARQDYHDLCWTRRRQSVIVASEPTTDDEVWFTVPNGCLLVVDAEGRAELLRLVAEHAVGKRAAPEDVRTIDPSPIQR